MFVAAVLKKMFDWAQFQSHYLMAVEIIWLIDLAESSLAYEGERLIAFHDGGPFFFGEIARLLLHVYSMLLGEEGYFHW